MDESLLASTDSTPIYKHCLYVCVRRVRDILLRVSDEEIFHFCDHSISFL